MTSALPQEMPDQIKPWSQKLLVGQMTWKSYIFFFKDIYNLYVQIFFFLNFILVLIRMIWVALYKNNKNFI